jgi:drug/metabolite transporter (DMT)-like permease
VSLPVAIALGVASAAVYGTSTVMQHRVATRTAAGDTGAAPAAPSGLFRIVRDPLFLLAMCGDAIGFLLQIGALASGKVVIVQPLVILLLPVALLVDFAFGGPRPRVADLLGCAGVIAGLAGFLVLIGRPPAAVLPSARLAGWTVAAALAAGALLLLAVRRTTARVRSAAYGVVAGSFFGLLAALVDAASTQSALSGFGSLFTTARGIALLIGIIVLGAVAIGLTQLSFQLGNLGTALPASLLADSLAGIGFGAALLREGIPDSVGHLVGYVVFLAAAVFGAFRLADPTHRSAPAHRSVSDRAVPPAL